VATSSEPTFAVELTGAEIFALLELKPEWAVWFPDPLNSPTDSAFIKLEQTYVTVESAGGC